MHGGGTDDDDLPGGDDDADDDAVDDDGADDDADGDDDDDATPAPSGFPDFITDNDDYFVTRIGAIPAMDEASFRLEISGLVYSPRTLTLDDLRMLPGAAVTTTVECIGNSSNGSLVGTASWEGFSLHELLFSLGIGYGATHVRFGCADGYWSSMTLEQVEDRGVVGALSMNGEELPEEQGYPLRFVLPGFYGVKHPAWVTKVELISEPIDDLYEVGGWDCSPAMPADSKIFFPEAGAEVVVGEPISVGGAAFGGTRIERVEVTVDDGATWQDATITYKEDLDHVWVFWRTEVTFDGSGEQMIRARATDIHGNTQPADDIDPMDGTQSWSRVLVQVVDSP